MTHKRSRKRKHNRSRLKPPPIALADLYRHKLNSANGNRPAVLKELREMDPDDRGFIVDCIAGSLKEALALDEEIDRPNPPSFQTTIPLY